jgi:erythrocyte band 7 integral membrane protein
MQAQYQLHVQRQQQMQFQQQQKPQQQMMGGAPPQQMQQMQQPQPQQQQMQQVQMPKIDMPAMAVTDYAAAEPVLDAAEFEDYKRREADNAANYRKHLAEEEIDTSYTCAENACACASRLIFPCCMPCNTITLMDYERGVLLRFGKKSHKSVLKGGMHFLLPYVEEMMKISVQEERLDIRKQSVITKEGFSLQVDGMVYFKVVDAHLAMLNVRNVRSCIEMLSQTKLRECIGIHTFEELTTSKDKMVATLQKILDTATDPWGVKVFRVELSDIICPPAMKAAMASEGDARIAATQFIIAAERDAKARMIQASASPILVNAEREAKARIIAAEGNAKATIARAQGEKNAALLIKEAAEKMAANPNAMQLRYLQTLPEMKNGVFIGGGQGLTLQI